jgi:predicted nucleic acid-binding protein
VTGLVYIDTSAIVKIIFEEPESAALKRIVDQLRAESPIYTSDLGLCELHRLARAEGATADHVQQAVSGFGTLPLDSQTYQVAAQNIDNELSLIEALHLAVAEQHCCATVLAYSSALAHAAQAAGMTVLSPKE